MAPFSQYDSLGALRHLVTLEGLSGQEIRDLLERAQRYLRAPGEIPVHTRSLEGITVGNIFTEPSTRTRASFELAARRGLCPPEDAERLRRHLAASGRFLHNVAA